MSDAPDVSAGVVLRGRVGAKRELQDPAESAFSPGRFLRPLKVRQVKCGRYRGKGFQDSDKRRQGFS